MACSYPFAYVPTCNFSLNNSFFLHFLVHPPKMCLEQQPCSILAWAGWALSAPSCKDVLFTALPITVSFPIWVRPSCPQMSRTASMPSSTVSQLNSSGFDPKGWISPWRKAKDWSSFSFSQLMRSLNFLNNWCPQVRGRSHIPAPCARLPGTNRNPHKAWPYSTKENKPDLPMLVSKGAFIKSVLPKEITS